MKKVFSLIRATMTSDMNIFKIRSRNKKNSIIFIIFISLLFMFAIWTYANLLFEKFAPLKLQSIVLSIFVFITSFMTLIQGIYKSGSLLFNCKDDQLLFSLPLKRSTILFVRIFKFYVFEFLFDLLFIVPLSVAYIRWADKLNGSFFLVTIFMLFMLPIIPIVISCIIGAITSSISSKFRYKNIIQTIISMVFLLLVLFSSYNADKIIGYIVKHASSINDLISKIYYPAGVYSSLVCCFDIKVLFTFFIINIVLFGGTIFILSKVYFKLNSNLKSISINKSNGSSKYKIKSNSVVFSLIKKELNTFFNTPVFIINAGFGLLLFIVVSILVIVKFDSVIPLITSKDGLNISKDLILSNKSILVLLLIMATSFMTSITNSVISLEGRNINILKSLPVSIKTILLSKVYSCLVLTTPVFLIGDLLLFIKFKISIVEMILLILLSILIPLVSHFVGLIVNLKYPKLDFENSTEVVKQSMSSFISVMIGMMLVVLNFFIIVSVMGKIESLVILGVVLIVYLFIDTILYFYLTKKSIYDFDKLTI